MDANERKVKQAIILEALGKCASLKAACELADVSRPTVYQWQKSNAAFREAIAEAQKNANDTIEDTIVLRAIEGIEEPLVSMGKVVYDGDVRLTTRKYSDGLLLALAKSRMMKYRDRADLDLLEQINEQTGGAISLNTKDMTSEELSQLKQLAQHIKAREENK